MSDYSRLMSEIRLIKQSLAAIERNSTAIGGWLPKKAVMRFFDYSDNQLRLLERMKTIETSKVGRRKFYSLNSIVELIERNRQ